MYLEGQADLASSWGQSKILHFTTYWSHLKTSNQALTTPCGLQVPKGTGSVLVLTSSQIITRDRYTL